MSLSDLASIGSLVSGVAVLISLIYLAMQISERQGMRMVRTFSKALVSGEHLSERWEISRDEWRERRADST